MELDRDRPSLIVVYGRKRVGKSTLLAHVCASRRAVYYQATEVVGSINLSMSKDEIANSEGAHSPILEGLESWDSVLAYVEQLADKHAANHDENLLVVFDEFPYLCEAVQGFPSIIQKVVDRVNRNDTPLDIVLCGSQISFMTEMLGEKSPLRGRQTLELVSMEACRTTSSFSIPTLSISWQPTRCSRELLDSALHALTFEADLVDPAVGIGFTLDGLPRCVAEARVPTTHGPRTSRIAGAENVVRQAHRRGASQRVARRTTLRASTNRRIVGAIDHTTVRVLRWLHAYLSRAAFSIEIALVRRVRLCTSPGRRIADHAFGTVSALPAANRIGKAHELAAVFLLRVRFVSRGAGFGLGADARVPRTVGHAPISIRRGLKAHLLLRAVRILLARRLAPAVAVRCGQAARRDE